MEIYFLRHAPAVERGTPGYPTDDRPLTEEGIRKMTKAAAGIRKVVPQIDLVLTSPLKRAFQTASITAKALAAEKLLRITKNLLPGASPDRLFEEMMKEKNLNTVIVVGHEPDMGLMASKLIGARSSAIEFKKGALCRIDVDKLPAAGTGQLIWHLSPKQLRMLSEK